MTCQVASLPERWLTKRGGTPVNPERRERTERGGGTMTGRELTVGSFSVDELLLAGGQEVI